MIKKKQIIIAKNVIDLEIKALRKLKKAINGALSESAVITSFH